MCGSRRHITDGHAKKWPFWWVMRASPDHIGDARVMLGSSVGRLGAPPSPYLTGAKWTSLGLRNPRAPTFDRLEAEANVNGMSSRAGLEPGPPGAAGQAVGSCSGG